jgi:5'-nucleotidase
VRILISNDDGVHAPGIRALHEELSIGHKATVIAPLTERSTTGHSLSLDAPLRLEKFHDDVYGCSGFPADCVLMGIGHLLKNDRPEVIVSGINRGANLAQDLYYSGTIAAAREGAFHGYPALAVSLVFEQMTDPAIYSTAAKIVKICLEYGLHECCPRLSLLNINVPNVEFKDLKGLRLTKVGLRHYSEEVHAKVDARGREYYWIAGIYKGFKEDKNTDCFAVSEKYVSITPHRLVDGVEISMEKLEAVIGKINESLRS